MVKSKALQGSKFKAPRGFYTKKNANLHSFDASFVKKIGGPNK